MEVFGTNTTYSRRLLVLPATYPRQIGTTIRPEDVLKVALHEYRVLRSQPKALTLLFTHGTSFNKDLWDIIVNDLLRHEQLAGRVKRVIAMDAVTHGDSALLNAGKLGDKAFWPDNAYDILTVIQTLGVSQPIVGIGHSFGGGTLCGN
jgi:pimeloyl-ACP methyl ester carboxylesterase